MVKGLVCPEHPDSPIIEQGNGPHLGEYCSVCYRWLRWVPQDIHKFVWPIGSKHQGHFIMDIARSYPSYLEWVARELSSSKPQLARRASEALAELRSESRDTPEPSQGSPGPRRKSLKIEQLDLFDSQ